MAAEASKLPPFHAGFRNGPTCSSGQIRPQSKPTGQRNMAAPSPGLSSAMRRAQAATLADHNCWGNKATRTYSSNAERRKKTAALCFHANGTAPGYQRLVQSSSSATALRVLPNALTGYLQLWPRLQEAGTGENALMAAAAREQARSTADWQQDQWELGKAAPRLQEAGAVPAAQKQVIHSSLQSPATQVGEAPPPQHPKR